jgi:hypothetical protein
MNLSKAKHYIKSSLNRHGATYTSDTDEFSGVVMKSDVGRDLARPEHTILADHDASVNDGTLVVDSYNNERFVPLMIERPVVAGGEIAYQKIYCRQVNASGSLKSYVEQSNASKDAWGVATGTEDTDYGWLTKKHHLWVSFENFTLKNDVTKVGNIEAAVFSMYIPWSVNASYTPIPGNRFTTTAGRDWKVEDVDDYSHKLQAYRVRVSPDDR